MICSNCRKKWFCIIACTSVNTALSLRQEKSYPDKKIIRLTWATR